MTVKPCHSKFIEESLVELDEEEVTVAELLKKRYHKYRDIGPFYKEYIKYY